MEVVDERRIKMGFMDDIGISSDVQDAFTVAAAVTIAVSSGGTLAPLAYAAAANEIGGVASKHTGGTGSFGTDVALGVGADEQTARDIGGVADVAAKATLIATGSGAAGGGDVVNGERVATVGDKVSSALNSTNAIYTGAAQGALVASAVGQDPITGAVTGGVSGGLNASLAGVSPVARGAVTGAVQGTVGGLLTSQTPEEIAARTAAGAVTGSAAVGINKAFGVTDANGNVIKNGSIAAPIAANTVTGLLSGGVNAVATNQNGNRNIENSILMGGASGLAGGILQQGAAVLQDDPSTKENQMIQGAANQFGQMITPVYLNKSLPVFNPVTRAAKPTIYEQYNPFPTYDQNVAPA